MAFDLKSWLTGFALGYAGRPLPVLGEAAYYLYNGVKLPKLPEWDREKFPYAVIEYCGDRMGYRTLYCFSEPKQLVYSDSLNAWRLYIPDGEVYLRSYRGIYANTEDEARDFLENAEYPEPTEKTGAEWLAQASELLWANYDIYDADGNLHLSTSNPVPIYE